MKQRQRVNLGSDQDIVRGAIADGDRRILERDGETVAVVLRRQDYEQISGRRSDDIWAGYDPEKARAALNEASGMFKGVDTEQWKRDIREARGHCPEHARTDALDRA